ncbi:hypothetical protein AVEN_155179-1 [Araneus ventricosus]|uniref:Uncharacterized protein n=2 Tax=Araneus ventricosus TaxID=182803 RepID=A0A4Y2D7L2_ARAVE|nr:hypothetical protein AVEN_6532-1 [Araneus ventricosus]GBM11941.1 hypothetical protein AVEN_254957-1 [Araneus ventricosus]GBM12107.1 hypothetical protein AVEN_155179-1 [Araneus ventricosus]
MYLFGPLKQHLGGKHFADDGDVQHEVLLWMRQQPKECYAAGIGRLIKRWDKCINSDGDKVNIIYKINPIDLQSVCLQDVVLVDKTDENRLGLSLVGQCYSIHLTAHI